METEPLTIEQLAGQRLLVGFEGKTFNDQLAFLIEKVRAAGIIFFAGNVGTPEEIRALSAAAQRCARACGQPGLIVAVDQEGGQVARLRAPFTEFPGSPAMTGLQEAEEFARVTAKELASVGINMDLAPVLDLAPEGVDSVMAKRAFAGDAKQVGRMGAAVIDGLQRRGIMAVAKHFPGIGRTTLDSHLDLPELAADPALLRAADLLPFSAAIRSRVAGIMLSHIRYTGFDPLWPASLSPTIARGLLRREMGYNGVVMTDDLDMGAIANQFDIPTAMGQILAGDVDLALVCHWGPAIETAFETLCRFFRDDADLRARAKVSARRVLDLKRRYAAGRTA